MLIDLRNKKFLKMEIPIKQLTLLKKSLTLIKQQKGKGLKILTPKHMVQRLPIAIAQVITGNTSENLLNEIRQIIYSLYRVKEITKKNI